jgi:hypothetical protein
MVFNGIHSFAVVDYELVVSPLQSRHTKEPKKYLNTKSIKALSHQKPNKKSQIFLILLIVLNFL